MFFNALGTTQCVPGDVLSEHCLNGPNCNTKCVSSVDQSQPGVWGYTLECA